MKMHKMEKEKLENILENSKSMSDIARIIFGKVNYTNRQKCKKILAENGVDWNLWLQSKKEEKKEIYCLNCGRLINTNDKRRKFCSRSCSASYNNKGVVRNGEKNNRTCCLCGKPLNYHQNKYCCQEHKAEFEHKQYIDRWKCGKESGLSGKYGISDHLRKYFLEKYNNACQNCGWSEVNRFSNTIPLHIHHIDGDCTNNKEDNLQLLCPNCHALTENYGSRNKNATRKDTRKRY